MGQFKHLAVRLEDTHIELHMLRKRLRQDVQMSWNTALCMLPEYQNIK